MINEIKVVYNTSKGIFEKAYAVIDGVPTIITKSKEIEKLLQNLKVQEGVEKLKDIPTSKYSLVGPSDVKVQKWAEDFEKKEIEYIRDNGVSLKKNNKYKQAKNSNFKEKLAKFAKGTVLVAGIAIVLSSVGCGAKKLYDKYLNKPVNEQTIDMDATTTNIINPIDKKYNSVEEILNDSSVNEDTKKFIKSMMNEIDASAKQFNYNGDSFVISYNPADLVAWNIYNDFGTYTNDQKLNIIGTKEYDILSTNVGSSNQQAAYLSYIYSAKTSSDLVKIDVEDENAQAYFDDLYSLMGQFLDAETSKEKAKISDEAEKLVSIALKGGDYNRVRIADRYADTLIHLSHQFFSFNGHKFSDKFIEEITGIYKESLSQVEFNEINSIHIKAACDDKIQGKESLNNLVNNAPADRFNNSVDVNLVVDVLEYYADSKNYMYDAEAYNKLYYAITNHDEDSISNTKNVNNQTGVRTEVVYENVVTYHDDVQVGDVVSGDDPTEINKLQNVVNQVSTGVTNGTITAGQVAEIATTVTDPSVKGYLNEVITGLNNGQTITNNIVNEVNTATTTGKDPNGNTVISATVITDPNGNVTGNQIITSNVEPSTVTVVVPTISETGTTTTEEPFTFDPSTVTSTTQNPNQSQTAINNRKNDDEDEEIEVEIFDYNSDYSSDYSSMSMDDQEALVNAMVEAMANQPVVEEEPITYTK